VATEAARRTGDQDLVEAHPRRPVT
jgi:hypothetical protein